MGGAVSSGRDNNELIDNLMGGGYIRTRGVERVFRVLDRADYMSPEARDQAYKDLAWRNGLLHLSAPCIYSEVMEALELKPGLSFLNLGSGTGYLSTLAGLVLGSSGISHGVDCYPTVIEYANRKLKQFLEKSVTLDEFDFCVPKFYCGNALSLMPLQATYDRVYCGAGVLCQYEDYFKQLVKVGGVLVMPLRDTLVQLRRVTSDEWDLRKLLNVSFALLRVPAEEDRDEPLKMDDITPPPLQVLARGVIRAALRRGLQSRQPELREPPPRVPLEPHPYPRRVCIPLDVDSDADGLNDLHDLDQATGANEMNALLSLVLSMGQNRVAGSLRLDSIDDFDTSLATSEEEEDEEGEEGADAGPEGAERGRQSRRRRDPQEPVPERAYRTLRPCLRPLRARRLRVLPAPPPGPDPAPTLQDEAVPTEVEVVIDARQSSSEVEEEMPSSVGSRSSTEPELEPETGRRTRRNGSKRQKLDSGIGEGASSASGSTPDKSSSESEWSEVGRSGCGRGRGVPDDGRALVRRLRLSAAMKAAVRELPLPLALQHYVNLGRTSDF